MTHARTALPSGFRLMALVAALCLPQVTLADEYSDVNQLMRSGKVAEALARADQSLAARPRDPQMRFLKGVLLTESGRTPDAIVTFTKLTEDYPELPEPYNNLAALYAGQSQFDKARAALEMAIRTNPSYARAHENLGDVYAKLASQAYGKALQLDANNTGLQPKLALIRELFSPAAKVGAKPAAAPAPVMAPAAAPAAAAGAPTATTSPAASPNGAAPSGEIESAVQAWAAAWSSKDDPGYLGAYGEEFDPPGKQSRKVCEDERRALKDFFEGVIG